MLVSAWWKRKSLATRWVMLRRSISPISRASARAWYLSLNFRRADFANQRMQALASVGGSWETMSERPREALAVAKGAERDWKRPRNQNMILSYISWRDPASTIGGGNDYASAEPGQVERASGQACR